MTFAASSIRNIAFVGHPSAGKTTLVDALAHLTGASPRKSIVIASCGALVQPALPASSNATNSTAIAMRT